MKKINACNNICSCALLCLSLALTGCSGGGGSVSGEAQADMQAEAPGETEMRGETVEEGAKPEDEMSQSKEPSKETLPQTATPEPEKSTAEAPEEPIINEADWSNYFGGLDGSAVIYDPSDHCYEIYNREAANTRRSPCSTFKIVSSLIALENGIIEPEDSTRAWSGENFWNEEWNRDIGFADAFHASCVWYFREVIDEIGAELMQKELERLSYGNCDISDWEGRLNTNNNNPALTGFWIESSLLISPKEQVEVLERIFGDASDFSEKTREELAQVMLLEELLLEEQSNADISIYGKTGLGKANGILVDAWYTGFAERAGRRIYFCVHLDETEDAGVSSATARQIAVNLVSDYLK